MPRMTRVPATLLAGLLLLGCNPSKNVFQLGLPGARIDMNVASVTQRFGYLDTQLHASGWSLRTFLPANEVCGRVVRTEEGVQYVSDGPYGTLTRGEDRCEAVGIGSLAQWRDKGPRGESRSLIPSAQASYRMVYEDEEVAFLRGDFPLASRLGFAGMGDTIAVVPKLAICQPPLARERSTLEYFFAGRNVLTLSSNQGRCPIEGLIRPLTAADLGS